jgi:glutamate-1-semialdehyde aminotransferase
VRDGTKAFVLAIKIAAKVTTRNIMVKSFKKYTKSVWKQNEDFCFLADV